MKIAPLSLETGLPSATWKFKLGLVLTIPRKLGQSLSRSYGAGPQGRILLCMMLLPSQRSYSLQVNDEVLIYTSDSREAIVCKSLYAIVRH